MVTQFKINNRGCSLANIENGRNAGQQYLKLSVMEAGFHDPRTVPVFAKGWIKEMNDADLEGRDPDFSHLIGDNVFDKETVDLGADYWHFRIENGQKVYDQLADGTRRTYRKMSVLVLYHTKKEACYDANDIPMFVPGVFNPQTGEPVYLTRTVRETVTDEDGNVTKRDKRFYEDGWAPAERRDRALEMFYEKATVQNTNINDGAPNRSGDPNQQGGGTAGNGAIVNPI
jgi:hypothetical protein